MANPSTEPASGEGFFEPRSTMTDLVLDLLDPERCAVLVVDLQNDYCSEAGALALAGLDISTIDPMVDVVENLVSEAHELSVPVVFLRNEHSEESDTPAWRRRTTHSLPICRAGTWGADFYRVRPSHSDTAIVKHRYSGFVGTSLLELLNGWGRTTVVVAGTATNVCVDTTARHAAMLDFDVVVVSDAVAATDPAAHTASLLNLERFFGHVVTAAVVRDAWRAQGRDPEAPRVDG